MRISTMQWQEGQDGNQQIYRERIGPAWWIWLAAAGFVGTVAIAYGFAFGPRAGWLVAFAGGLLAAALLTVAATVVRIDERVLRVGRARLPLHWVGRIVPLDEELSTEARSTRLDPAAFLSLRTSGCSTSIMVEVTDPDDPHPYWLFSTRDPEKVASALRQAVEVDMAVRSAQPEGNEESEDL
ncbi:MAG: hypothetical protein CMH41_05920 [Micrococcales bacterium]|nr:hypothetical protein [Micrococcales bacterium]